jgi:hypothetical protein
MPPAPRASICDEVDERAGLLNAINLLPARRPDTAPVVAFGRTVSGRYRVTFDFAPRVTAVLKTSLPPAVRRWRGGEKCWEISADWAGPAAAALRNAGVTVRGLGDIEMSWWCLAPVSITKAGHCAYLAGRCVACTRAPHRAGDLRCERCHRNRVAHQHHVHEVLADRGLAPWPTAVPSAGDALRCRYPLWVLDDDITVISAPDYTGAADAVLSIARAESAPGCPVCDRKPAKGAPFHVGCRRNLLATLVDKPLSKPRNRAFQDGLCVACRARPHLPRGICCADCARLMQLIRDRFAKQEGEQP